MSPGQEARVKIDQLLEQAGWRVSDAAAVARPLPRAQPRIKEILKKTKCMKVATGLAARRAAVRNRLSGVFDATYRLEQIRADRVGVGGLWLRGGLAGPAQSPVAAGGISS